MSTGLLIAVVLLGVLILVFFLVAGLMASSETKERNVRFDEMVAQPVGVTDGAAESAEMTEITTTQKSKPVTEDKAAEENAADFSAETDKEPQVVIGDFGEEDDRFTFNVNRVSFSQKLLAQPEDTRGYFNLIHNQLMSYKKVAYRLSFRCASYRLGRKLLAKIFIKGKTMKLALDLDVKAFSEKTYFQKDMSSVKSYAEVPFVVKVKSDRAAKRAVSLIDALAENNSMTKNPRFSAVDAVAEIASAQ